MVMQWSPLIVTMAVLLLVVSVACGGQSKPTPSPTATSAPSPTASPTVTQLDFDLLPEASAPAGLGTVAWPKNVQESSALFGRLPSEIAGHRIKARFEQSKPGVFATTYEDEQEIGVAVLDLAKGDFFPPDTNAGQNVAYLAQLPQWGEAAGREGDLAWVQFKDDSIYGMIWGNAPSSFVFQAMANDLRVLMALVEAMVSAASG